MPAVAFPKPTETALIGRAREIERLDEMIERAAAGTKRTLLLVGDAGVGKSTLLRWGLERAAERRFVTASARVPASAGLPPRFPVGEILQGLAASCAASRVRPPDALDRMIETLSGSKEVDAYPVDVPQLSVMLEAITEQAPVLIAIDDIHWAGEDGMSILLPALKLVDGPVLLIATARTEAAHRPPPFLEPSGDMGLDTLEVCPLGSSETAALAERILGGQVLPSLADRLATETMGNPLFVAELLRDWHEGDALVRVGGFWSVRPDASVSTGSLTTTVGFRLARLDERDASVAQALALLGRPATFDDVCGIADLEPEETLEVLDRLERRGLCAVDQEHPARYQLAHPLYVSGLKGAMTAARRAAVHAQIFAALLTRTDARVPASELAHHAVAAHRPPANVRELLEAAAAEAEAAGSFREAASWYAHLSDVIHDDRDALQRIKYRQARASVHFDADQAVRLYSEALELSSSADARAEVLTGRAYAFRVLGAFARAMEDLEKALPEADAITSQHVRHSLGVLYGIGGDIHRAEGALLALRAGALDSEILGKALGHLGMVALSKGDIAGAEAFCREALAARPSRAYEHFVESNLLWILIVMGKWSEAALLGTKVVQASAAAGDLWNLGTSLSNIARLYAWTGDFPRAVDSAVRSLRLSLRTENLLCRVDAHAAFALALFEQGSASGARQSMLEALEALESLNEPVEEAAYFGNASEILLNLGELDEARELIARGIALAARAPHWLPYLERLACEAAWQEGDSHASNRALDLLEAPCLMPFERANQHRAVSKILWGLDRERALAEAQAAAAIYAELGAIPRQAQVQEWIQARTKRRGRPSTRREGLTPREWEILAVVCQGKSNADIARQLHLSEATVRTHLERLRRATGAASRTELVLFGLRKGLAGNPDTAALD